MIDEKKLFWSANQKLSKHTKTFEKLQTVKEMITQLVVWL